ncbi:MAG: NADH-quinone oxidoreductase subunit J [Streptosporangiaceae bacterium]|jgi:NADH-quinone oxidoreductase subunit J
MTHVLAAGNNADQVASQTVWWILAFLAVGGGLGMISARRAVHSALLLGLTMLSLSIMYALLGAPFLAFVQVIVYTGAVLMLFLFVLMLVGVSSREAITETIRGQRLWAGIAGIALIVLLILGTGHAAIGSPAPETASNSTANLTGIAQLIFTTYVFPFEVTSALLLAAALGAMVLAHRERTSPKPTQLDLSRRRVASGADAVGEPPPGVYALHDAVDMPARLPDGSVTQRSVSAAIKQRDVDLHRKSGREMVAEDLEAITSAEGGDE